MDERVEHVLHEALSEYAVQTDMYLAKFAGTLSPGLGRHPLLLLLRLRRLGPLRESDLAAQLHLAEAEVRRHVADLVGRGLAVRERHGPGHVVRLAERVVEPLELAEAERRGRILDSLGDWSVEDKEAFARLFAKFVQRDDLVVRTLRPSRVEEPWT